MVFYLLDFEHSIFLVIYTVKKALDTQRLCSVNHTSRHVTHYKDGYFHVHKCHILYIELLKYKFKQRYLSIVVVVVYVQVMRLVLAAQT
jgi:hypothetical protein